MCDAAAYFRLFEEKWSPTAPVPAETDSAHTSARKVQLTAHQGAM